MPITLVGSRGSWGPEIVILLESQMVEDLYAVEPGLFEHLKSETGSPVIIL
jgi:hypothetical protein